jgi:hypothetical protein
MEFAVGTTLSGISLLAAFKGAIESYQLISDIAKARPQSDFLVTKAAIERQRLASWGETYGISATSSNSQSPANYDDNVKKLLLRTLASVENTLTDMDQLVHRYGLQPVAIDLSQNGAVDSELHPKSTLVEALAKTIKSGGGKTSKRNKIKWAVDDNAKFEGLCSQLKYWNDSLYGMVNPPQTLAFQQTLSVYMGSRPSTGNAPMLQRAARNNLLATCTALEQLMLQPNLAAVASLSTMSEVPVSSLLTVDLKPFDETNCFARTLPRSMSIYHNGNGGYLNVMVEWKEISSNTTADDVLSLTTRMKQIGSLLSLPKEPESHTLECLGIVDDTAYEMAQGKKRLGWIYDLPAPDVESDRLPASLTELLELTQADEMVLPRLGDRFKLAKSLASALILMHATDIHHKGIHADNILFFRKQVSSRPPQITDPFVAGFAYAKLRSDNKYAEDPAANTMHQRPEYASSQIPYTKLDDVYSLGVVLFEIGMWKPARLWRKAGMSPRKFRDELVNDLPALGVSAGEIYQNVVHCCLTGNFGVQAADADGANLERAYHARVIKELEMCRA